MVDITQFDFNKEMDAYLSKSERKKPKRDQKVEVYDTDEFEKESVEFYGEKRSILARLKLWFKPVKNDPYEDGIEEDYLELEEKTDDPVLDEVDHGPDEFDEFVEKKGLFSRLLDWFRSDGTDSGDDIEGEEEYDEVEDLDGQVLPDDVKEILRLQHSWLNRLGHDEISRFKASDDFKRYKEILRKYNLIKKD